MCKRARYYLLLAIAVVAMGGQIVSAATKNKAKKPVVLTAADTLSYNDSRRYNYFFLEAVRQQEAGHYAAAFDLVSHCLDINPKAAEAYFLRARYLSMLRKDSLALNDLEKAASLQPGNAIYQEKVAQFYIGMGNYDKATKAYEQLYANNRDRSDVLNVLVQLYQQQKDYGKMIEAINKILDEVNEKGLYKQWKDDATELAKSLGIDVN